MPNSNAPESKIIDDLLIRLKSILPMDALNESKQSIEQEIKIVMQEFLSGLDLVTREEFEIQTKVLAKTRAKLEALSEQVDQLEKKTSQ